MSVQEAEAKTGRKKRARDKTNSDSDIRPKKKKSKTARAIPASGQANDVNPADSTSVTTVTTLPSETLPANDSLVMFDQAITAPLLFKRITNVPAPNKPNRKAAAKTATNQKKAKDCRAVASQSAAIELPSLETLNSTAVNAITLASLVRDPLRNGSIVLTQSELLRKWYTTSVLAKVPGLVFTKGKFTAKEREIIKKCVIDVAQDAGVSETTLISYIFLTPKDRSEFRPTLEKLWDSLHSELPGRPIHSINEHLKRDHNPEARQGPYSVEDDATIVRMVAAYGPDWVKIGPAVGRSSQDVKDRYRNLHVEKSYNEGRWNSEEVDQLRAMLEKTKDVQQAAISWNWVATGVQTRSGIQCRDKFLQSSALQKILTTTDPVSPASENKAVKESVSRYWKKPDDLLLIRCLIAANADHEHEIDWANIASSGWTSKSSIQLRRRYKKMLSKAQVKLDNPQLTFQQLLDYQFEKLTGRKRADSAVVSPTKPISAELVSTSDDDSDS